MKNASHSVNADTCFLILLLFFPNRVRIFFLLTSCLLENYFFSNQEEKTKEIYF